MIKEKSRECRVWVTSHQVNTEGEKQVMKTENKGRLSEREGVLYVLYEEKTEEGEVVKNLLKIEKELLRASLKKSGAVSWKMVFEQGKYEKSEYQTPYGTLEIGAETKEVKAEKEEEKTSLQLVYTLFIQGEKQADCRLEIMIR